MEPNPIHYAFQNSSRFLTISSYAFTPWLFHGYLTWEEVSSQLAMEVL